MLPSQTMYAATDTHVAYTTRLAAREGAKQRGKMTKDNKMLKTIREDNGILVGERGSSASTDAYRSITGCY